MNTPSRVQNTSYVHRLLSKRNSSVMGWGPCHSQSFIRRNRLEILSSASSCVDPADGHEVLSEPLGRLRPILKRYRVNLSTGLAP